MEPDIRVYEKPFLYDIAFGYRDIRAECDLLAAWCRRVSGEGRPQSVLEMAAGPADHAIELASRGARAAALDLSPAMCEYARNKVAARGVSVDIQCGDMTDFALPERFDLGLLMISSIVHIYTLDSLVRHLRCVARHLSPRGAYILEMPHPADLFGREPPQRTHWTIARDGIEVETFWGASDDPYDPVALIREARVEMRVRRDGREEVHVDRCRMRDWTATEFEAAVRLSGVFEIAERHGDFKLDAPFDTSKESWRMIQVLRKTGE